MKILRRVLVFGLAIAALVLGYRLAQANGQLLTLDLLYVKVPDVAQWMVVLGAFATGAVLAVVLTVYQMAKLGLVARRYRKTVRGLESEIHQLRNLPLAEEEGSASPAGPGAQRGSPAGPRA